MLVKSEKKVTLQEVDHNSGGEMSRSSWCGLWCACFRRPSGDINISNSFSSAVSPEVESSDFTPSSQAYIPVSFVPKSVLIIDDSRVVRGLLQRQFETKYPGINVLVAANSNEADAFLDGEGYKNFDLISFDYELGAQAEESGVGILFRHLGRISGEVQDHMVLPRIVFNTSSMVECTAELKSKGLSLYVAAVCEKVKGGGDAEGLVKRALKCFGEFGPSSTYRSDFEDNPISIMPPDAGHAGLGL